MPGQSVLCSALGNSSSPRLCSTHADPTGSAGAGGTSRGCPSFHLQQCPHQRAGRLGPRAGLLPAGLGLSPPPPTCQLQNQTARAVEAPNQPGATWGVRGAQVCKAAQGQPTLPCPMTDIPNQASHNHCSSPLTLPLQRTVCHR